jgi:hypothetical protein
MKHLITNLINQPGGITALEKASGVHRQSIHNFLNNDGLNVFNFKCLVQGAEKLIGKSIKKDVSEYIYGEIK